MISKINTVIKNLSWSENYLRRFDILRPRGECEDILSHILDCERVELYLGEKTLEGGMEEEFKQLVIRRARRFPLQYLLGKAYFYGEEFKVTKSVLIPRPETEVLLEKVIELAGKYPHLSGIFIADIGTGSGNIAICLKKSIDNCRVMAVDISPVALEVARENASRHTEQIEFRQGDLLAPLEGEKADIIVSNPPYIKSTDFKSLPPELGYEPRSALDGREDGLYYLRRLLEEAPSFLKEGGYLVMEIGEGQVLPLKEIFASFSHWRNIEAIKDLNGVERVISAQFKGLKNHG